MTFDLQADYEDALEIIAFGTYHTFKIKSNYSINLKGRFQNGCSLAKTMNIMDKSPNYAES